jgi:hypothetical protein
VTLMAALVIPAVTLMAALVIPCSLKKISSVGRRKENGEWRTLRRETTHGVWPDSSKASNRHRTRDEFRRDLLRSGSDDSRALAAWIESNSARQVAARGHGQTDPVRVGARTSTTLSPVCRPIIERPYLAQTFGDIGRAHTLISPTQAFAVAIASCRRYW